MLPNIDKIHTTKLGKERIKRNLKLDTDDVIDYLKNKMQNENCKIYQIGKNYYCEVENIKVTINSYNYCVITAHIM